MFHQQVIDVQHRKLTDNMIDVQPFVGLVKDKVTSKGRLDALMVRGSDLITQPQLLIASLSAVGAISGYSAIQRGVNALNQQQRTVDTQILLAISVIPLDSNRLKSGKPESVQLNWLSSEAAYLFMRGSNDLFQKR